MSKEIAYLEYVFMFKPDASWSHASDFEKSLVDFFAAHGLEAEVIPTVAGQPGKKILFIDKAEAIIPIPGGGSTQKPTSNGKPQPMKVTLDKFRNAK